MRRLVAGAARQGAVSSGTPKLLKNHDFSASIDFSESGFSPERVLPLPRKNAFSGRGNPLWLWLTHVS